MNDKSELLDTWEVNETLNEDFDFGEGDTQKNPIKIKPLSKYNKKIIGFIFVMIIVFVIILGLGYRAYSHKSLASKNAANKTEFLKASLPTETTNPRPAPKNINEASEDIKKPSNENEFEAALSDTSSAPIVPTPALIAPKSTPVSALAPEDIPLSTILNAPVAEKLLEDSETPKPHKNLNELNNQIASILNQIQYLDTYSREVSDNLNKLKTSLSTMDNRLLALVELTATLSQDVGTVKSEMGQIRATLKENSLDTEPLFSPNTKQAQKAVPPMVAEAEYKVHAIIPGRAWLKSVKGQIITVTEGDSIGRYGKVLAIDAPNNVVLTSSGAVFR